MTHWRMFEKALREGNVLVSVHQPWAHQQVPSSSLFWSSSCCLLCGLHSDSPATLIYRRFMKHNNKYQTPSHTHWCCLLGVKCRVTCCSFLWNSSVQWRSVFLSALTPQSVISDKLKTVLPRSLDPNEKDKHPILPGALCQYWALLKPANLLLALMLHSLSSCCEHSF